MLSAMLLSIPLLCLHHYRIGGHILRADTNTHLLQIFKIHAIGCSLQKTYSFASSQAEQNCDINSRGTPYGWHRICEKLGHKVPLNGVFKYRHFTGIICPPAIHPKTSGLITTRILRLQGLELGKNQGYDNHRHVCCDTCQRCVYIHGTNLEKRIPQPISDGCLLLSNKDMLELFQLSYVGDLLYITPPKKNLPII